MTFDYRLLTPGGLLVAYINDIEVGRVLTRATAPMEEFATKVIPIDPISLFGDETFPEVFLLKLELEGGPGMTIQLDNISLANLNLVNGDFSTGDLTGWQFDDGGGAAIVTNGLNPVFVPEPATATLGLLSLSALGLLLGHRRRG